MRFRFKALDARQQFISGEMEAANLDALLQRLQLQGFELIQVRRRRSPRIRPPSRRDMIDFCFHVEHLLNAGIPLLDALNDLGEHGEEVRLRSFCQQLASAVSGGQSLSDALQATAAQLEPAFIGIIRAGEISGQLPEVLQRLGNNLRQAEELVARASLSLIYPALAGSLVIGASIFLLLFLVPQIRGFLGDSGLALPLHSRLLFAAADFLGRHWPLVVGIPPCLLLIFAGIVRSSPSMRLHLDRQRLQLPLTGAIRRKLTIARLADLLALLYATGIPLLDALESLQKSCTNRFIALSLQKIRHTVEQGSSLADAFAQHKIFSPLLIRMLQVGEKTGALDSSLSNIARLYEREARESIAKLQSLLEPALTLSIGLLLGWIMLSVLQPIYSIIGQTRQ
jgi:type IV pilus assembly protein PilC